jgi:hypothetical protein
VSFCSVTPEKRVCTSVLIERAMMPIVHPERAEYHGRYSDGNRIRFM